MATVTVVLCTYNSEAYLQPLLDSILNNEYTDFHLYVQDDCSTDGTLDILRAVSDNRMAVSVNEAPSGGAGQNFMRALLACPDSRYIMFADADDVWAAQKIGKTLAAMQAAEDMYGEDVPVLVHSDLAVVDARLREISPSLWRYEQITPSRTELRQMLAQNNVTGCAMMVNRALADCVKELPQNFVMHDWWLALCAAAFGHIVALDEPLIRYRQHGDNSVGAYNAASLSASAKRLTDKERVRRIYLSMFRQAGCFADTYQDRLSPAQLKLCRAYAGMERKGHIGRIFVLLRYGFWKNTWLRNVGQLLSI